MSNTFPSIKEAPLQNGTTPRSYRSVVATPSKPFSLEISLEQYYYRILADFQQRHKVPPSGDKGLFLTSQWYYSIFSGKYQVRSALVYKINSNCSTLCRLPVLTKNEPPCNTTLVRLVYHIFVYFFEKN